MMTCLLGAFPKCMCVDSMFYAGQQRGVAQAILLRPSAWPTLTGPPPLGCEGAPRG
jgi:hypothetical protein